MDLGLLNSVFCLWVLLLGLCCFGWLVLLELLVVGFVVSLFRIICVDCWVLCFDLFCVWTFGVAVSCRFVDSIDFGLWLLSFWVGVNLVLVLDFTLLGCFGGFNFRAVCGSSLSCLHIFDVASG